MRALSTAHGGLWARQKHEHLVLTCRIKEEIGDESALADGMYMCHFQGFHLHFARRLSGVVQLSLKKLCFTHNLPGKN
jgi:hypothetical protein